MARKQETPAVTAETNTSVAAPAPSPAQPLVASPAASASDSAVSSPLGEETKATAHGPDTGSIDNAGQEQLAEQVGLSDSQDDEPGADTGAGGEEPVANLNPAEVQIYPLRSYMDEGELRRRGGPSYLVPRRHAEDLLQRKLASLEPLEE